VSAKDNEPATKGDIAHLDVKIDGLETKIHGLETKIDGLETKTDGLETKIDRLEVKTDRLEVKTDKIWNEVVNTWTRMDRMEERLVARMDAGFDRVTQVLDSFAAKMESYARETVIIPKTLDAHGEQLRDHERRIAAVESSRDG